MSGDLAVIDPPQLSPAPAVTGPQDMAATSLTSDPASTATAAITSADSDANIVRELYQLTKPRIVMMILITTTMAAIFAAGFDLSGLQLIHLLLGTAAVAGSASAMNQWMEQKVDGKMQRTMLRPLPAGRLSSTDALIFGMSIGVLGTGYLVAFVGLVPALVGVATWVGYVLIYTPLKQITSWNTTVGAIAGALPMMMGYTGAGGSVTDVEGWLLVAVLFLWQYPHFMAIAWMYRRQYEAAGFKMTPVVEPSGRSAGWQAIAGALALPTVLATLVMPYSWAPLFAILAFAASLGMIRSAFRFCGSPDDVNARKLLLSSLVQLPASLGVLILARLFG